VPPALEARLSAGGQGWLAEFRRATCVFVNLVGVSFAGEDEIARLNAVVQAIQHVVHRYDGSIAKLVESDKGTVLFAAFGLPPRAHEDDPARGIRAALEIEEAVADHDLRSAIGVTTGTIFCGPIGAPDRRDFAIVGDIVNLAARLMQAASDDILCDAATALVFDSIEYDELSPLRIKGKADTVRVFRPHGDMPRVIRGRSERVPLVGRGAERGLTSDTLDRLAAGLGGIVVIEGEAGIGKSRLVEDLIEQAETRGLRVASGWGSAVDISTPYFAWRQILWDALELGSVAANPGARRRHVLRWLRGHSLPLEEAALLNSVVGLRLPDDPTVAAYTPEARADRTKLLLGRVLAAAAGGAPLVITIDDAQWLDASSWALGLQVRHELPGVLIVLAARPLTEPTAVARELLDGSVRVPLDRLSPDETLQLIRRSLGVDDLPDEVRDLILMQAEGHPFFSEELAFSLRDTGVVVVEAGSSRLADANGSLDRLAVPDTVQGVIMSRIDHLEARQQLVLKTASVLGRDFAVDQVRDIFPAEGERGHVANELSALTARGLLSAAGGSAYTFRHGMTREVAYESLVYSQRRLLHRAAAIWLEDHAENLDAVDALLAHHWLRAAGDAGVDVDALGKAEFYLARAGAAAVRQGAFVEAEEFLGQALACHARLPERDRSQMRELEILRHLGTATFAIRGFGSPDARRVYERTFALARGRVGDRELFPILWGLWITTHFLSAERAVGLGDELMQIAEREDDDEFRLQAHHALWTSLIQIPDYPRARRHIDAGVRLYRPEWHERHCAEFGGHDPGSCAQRAIALSAWATGHVDEAVVAGRDAIRLAQDHDFSKLNAMLAVAFVHRQRGELDRVADDVDAIVARARDRGLLGYVDWAAVMGAWVRGRQGDLSGGITAMMAAIDRLGLRDSGYLAMLAELYLLDGRTADGLELIDELLAVVEHKGERHYEPELHRLRGELLAAHPAGVDTDDDTAERCLRRALELANAQGAQSFALRAGLSLATLLSSTERAAEGAAVLRGIYARFSEGFDTHDLVASRSFLEQHA
jgi:tetratricopeptide (TPR) repeat protein